MYKIVFRDSKADRKRVDRCSDALKQKRGKAELCTVGILVLFAAILRSNAFYTVNNQLTAYKAEDVGLQ